jgi:hypothetical protein
MKLFRTARFRSLYKKLPPPLKKKTDRKLKYLAKNLRHPSLRAKKMTNRPDIWEAAVDYHNRLTFKIVGNKIILRVVGPHDVLRKP